MDLTYDIKVDKNPAEYLHLFEILGVLSKYRVQRFGNNSIVIYSIHKSSPYRVCIYDKERELDTTKSLEKKALLEMEQ
jgi:hypothetical protein